MDMSEIPTKSKRAIYEKLLKSNATLVEVNFGLDKKDYLMIRNTIPITGISYDLFNCTYEAHLAGVKFFHEKLKPELE